MSVTFQSCLFFLDKIPKKLKYFVMVFKKLPLHKIEILMEDNLFYSELYNILQEVYRNKPKRKGNSSVVSNRMSNEDSKSLREESKIENSKDALKERVQKEGKANVELK